MDMDGVKRKKMWDILSFRDFFTGHFSSLPWMYSFGEEHYTYSVHKVSEVSLIGGLFLHCLPASLPFSHLHTVFLIPLLAPSLSLAVFYFCWIHHWKIDLIGKGEFSYWLGAVLINASAPGPQQNSLGMERVEMMSASVKFLIAMSIFVMAYRWPCALLCISDSATVEV